MNLSSVHVPMPVAESGVIFAELTLFEPRSNVYPPAYMRVRSGPCCVRGEWQVPQSAMVIRYRPYFTESDSGGRTLLSTVGCKNFPGYTTPIGTNNCRVETLFLIGCKVRMYAMISIKSVLAIWLK